jgi:hypothetical protein
MSLKSKSRLGAFAGRLCFIFGIESGDIAKRHWDIRRIVLNQSFNMDVQYRLFLN